VPTSGWHICQLYDPACDVHARCEESLEMFALRRAQHERMPSLRHASASPRAAH